LIEPQLILYSALIWLVTLVTLVAVKEVFLSKPCEEMKEKIEELKQARKDAEEALTKQRQYYETLLKEAAVKNTVMIALYNAWKGGKLRECYSSGGEVKILADGTLLCQKEKIEDSYAIEVEEEAEEE